MQNKLQSLKVRAFSLVEVVLAIGVISFCLLAVLGLMPVGLSTMRQAMDATIETQIVRQISGEALLTPFSQLGTTFSNKTFYFDAEGIEETGASDKTRYSAVTSLTNTAYPGSGDATGITNSISTLRLDLVTAPNVNAKLKTTNTYNIRIPNSGG